MKRFTTASLATIIALCLIAAVPAFAQEADAEGWISLFNGENLDGWHLRHDGEMSWTVSDGMMSNAGHGIDLVSDVLLGDIELHAEFCYPEGSNSGIYLQGRYEVQICDSSGWNELNNSMCGAIYGKIVPSENAAKAPGEWQTIDITFAAPKFNDAGEKTDNARISVILNDTLIVDDAEIDGLTGGALDDAEAEPGPVFVQGDHGVIDYRNIRYRPLAAE